MVEDFKFHRNLLLSLNEFHSILPDRFACQCSRYSEGKAERNVDILSDAADLVLQQPTVIKGLKEV